MKIDFNPDEFLAYLGDKAGAASLDALGKALGEAANSGSKFLQEQAVLTSKYLKMRKSGELSGEEFKSLIADLNAALQAELLKMNLTSRMAAQKLISSLLEILKGSLSVLITFV